MKNNYENIQEVNKLLDEVSKELISTPLEEKEKNDKEALDELFNLQNADLMIDSKDEIISYIFTKISKFGVRKLFNKLKYDKEMKKIKEIAYKKALCVQQGMIDKIKEKIGKIEDLETTNKKLQVAIKMLINE